MTTDGSVASAGGVASAGNGVAAAGGGGVIHDLGYRRYEGQRLGRPGIIRALYWHSARMIAGRPRRCPS